MFLRLVVRPSRVIVLLLWKTGSCWDDRGEPRTISLSRLLIAIALPEVLVLVGVYLKPEVSGAAIAVLGSAIALTKICSYGLENCTYPPAKIG